LRTSRTIHVIDTEGRKILIVYDPKTFGQKETSRLGVNGTNKQIDNTTEKRLFLYSPLLDLDGVYFIYV
jgi:hypothetical protein